MTMLKVNEVSKVYEGKVPYRALNNITFSMHKGEFVAIMGPSGSGKTTLLNIIATIDEPTTGKILIDGENPHQLNKNKLAKFRRRELGFVLDRKSTRLNSSHVAISYAVFCLKKKIQTKQKYIV